jgi:hypothetical protein
MDLTKVVIVVVFVDLLHRHAFAEIREVVEIADDHGGTAAKEYRKQRTTEDDESLHSLVLLPQ